MSASNQMTEQDHRTDRTNKVVTSLVGCVLLGIGGFMAFQNSDSLKNLKVPDRNKMWADAWQKKLSKPLDLPEQKPLIDWSDPKNDPKKLWEQPIAKQSLFQPQLQQQPSGGSQRGSWRR